MGKKESEPLTVHPISLYQGDFQKLLNLYPGEVSGSKIIRVLVRRTLKRVEARVAEGAPIIEPAEIDDADLAEPRDESTS